MIHQLFLAHVTWKCPNPLPTPITNFCLQLIPRHYTLPYMHVTSPCHPVFTVLIADAVIAEFIMKVIQNSSHGTLCTFYESLKH